MREASAAVSREPSHRLVLSEAFGRVEWIPPLARYAHSVGMTWWALLRSVGRATGHWVLGGLSASICVICGFSVGGRAGGFAPLRLCVFALRLHLGLDLPPLGHRITRFGKASLPVEQIGEHKISERSLLVLRVELDALADELFRPRKVAAGLH